MARTSVAGAGTLGLAIGLLAAGPVFAAGEVTSLFTSEREATPFRYQSDGTEYTWGLGMNQLLEGFISEDRTFGYAQMADRVELQRDDVPATADGEPCGVFVERLDATSTELAADYPHDADGNAGDCDMAEILVSRVLNRGTLDLFSNRPPDAKNIERVDYLFDSGILAPVTPEGLAGAGHVVADKGGNNRLKIAAVLSVDMFGQPASYGRPILVREVGCMDPDVCYGTTDVTHDYAFFTNASTAPQGLPSDGRQSTESVAMAFVSTRRLGLKAGQRYFGFSLFADDVDTDDHDLLDPASFPDDTENEHVAPGDAADVYGGLSGFFIDETFSNGSGRVFLDENGDGLPDDTEAGIADIQIQLYRDTDGNGVFDPTRDDPVCNATDTDMNGGFVLPGLPDGDYFAVVRENDPEMPAGLELGNGRNPLPFSVAGNDVDNLDFPFSSGGPRPPGGADDGGAGTGGVATGGADDGGGVDAGSADAGEADAGSADAGGADSGEAESGGADAGEADAGGADAGSADAGEADAGGADAGGADSGEADSGGPDAGEADAGSADAGEADAGGADSGVADAGSADAGEADAGGADAGSADAGEADAGGADAGGADSGEADSGGADAGEADAGGADAGGADSGEADSGGADAGEADAGGADAGTADSGQTDAGGADAGTADSGTADSGSADSGEADSGATDSGETDGGGADGDTPVIRDPDPGANRDDPETRAEPDEFNVFQGESATVNVIANDGDAAGSGLTVIRVGETPNATIEIIENQVVYTPDPNFYGTDAFTYEIRDADGQEATGSAVARVIRFSDINNNGENDFAECNCTDLTLETGVHGSGVGGLSLWMLLSLGLAVSGHVLLSGRLGARRDVRPAARAVTSRIARRIARPVSRLGARLVASLAIRPTSRPESER